MKTWLKKTFAVTDKGASDLIKSSFSAFMVYMIGMLPIMLLMIFANQLLLGDNKGPLFYAISAVCLVVVVFIILWNDYDSMYTSLFKESANLRLGIADTLSKLPLSYFSKHDLSDLAQTIMSDVAAMEHAFGHAISKVLGFAVFFPIIVVLLLIGNVKMGLAVLLPLVISFIFLICSKSVQRNLTTKYYKKLRENSEQFQETIELQQEIKSFGLSGEIKEKLYKRMEESEKIQLRTEISQVIPIFFSELIVHLSLAIVIIIGVVLYTAGEINIVYFIGYILASAKIKEGIDSLYLCLAEIFYIDARVKRIREINETEVQEGKEIDIKNFGIELKNVSFGYNEDVKVLKDVSFTAKQNEVTALVGMSGCGKTSILRLISRLYDYDDGEIIIDGEDIKNISTKSLFEKISIVFQDVTLFNTSIMENIRLGKITATDEEVKKAALLANCEDFIQKLPEGYDTKIGENGAMLSGGERQRISIARAFLKDAPVIILDEVSASLDIGNEKKIQDSLNKLIKNKTVVIISHRLKSIENTDKIVVINEGEIEAFGKHADVLKDSKTYQKLMEKSELAEKFQY